MTMTLDTVILDIMTAMQALNATIPGVQAPPPQLYPTMLNTTNGQPFAMTWPGDGENWQKGGGYSQGAPRIYRVLVYLDPVAQSDIPSHVVDGALILQQFINLYVKSTNTPLIDPGTGPGQAPYQATIESGPTGSHITDGGLVPTLLFGGVPWFGFELSIPVRWQGAQV